MHATARSLGALVVGAAALLGCGDDGHPDATLPDASNGSDAGAMTLPMPAPPEEPATVARPSLVPCRDGWREVVGSGDDPDPTTCDPWPESGRVECGPGEAHFVGTSGCATVGVACPEGEWPDDLPTTGVIYVRAGAATGGDGTRGAPLATITEAVGAATAPTVIALSTGEHAGGATLPAGITLRGACAAATRVIGAEAGVVLMLAGEGAAVQDVTLDGGALGLVSGLGVAARAAGVVVESATQVGLLVHGTFVGERVLVKDIETADGAGVGVTGEGALDLRRSLVLRATHFGIAAQGGGRIVLSDVGVSETGSLPGSLGGIGVILIEGAELVATGLALSQNEIAGVLLQGPGSSARITEAVIRDASTTGTYGRGIAARASTSLVLERSVLERNKEVGLAAFGGTTTVELTDVVVRDTELEPSSGDFGNGIVLDVGARLVATRLHIARNIESGLDLREAASAMVDHLTVVDTQLRADGFAGNGVRVTEGAIATIRGLRAARNGEVGVVCRDSGSSLELTDGDITLTRAAATGEFGRALEAAEDGRIVGARIRATRNAEHGIAAYGAGTVLDLTDVIVEDTLGRPTGWIGRGLDVVDGATARIERGRFARNRDVGVSVFSAGSELVLVDVVVEDTLEAACATGVCEGRGAGSALGVYLGGHAEVTRFAFVRSALCGVQLSRGGTADLHEGLVAENAIGANVQTVDFDLERLNNRVIFRDNDVVIDASALPVPDPAGP